MREDPFNANEHSDLSYEEIAGSYARFGQQKICVADRDGVMHAGNGQLVAARQLGWTHIATVASDLPDQELELFSLADNQISRRAVFNYRLLKEKLQSAFDAGVPIDDLGWQPHELAPILQMEWTPAAPADTGAPAAPAARESEAEALRDKWGCRRGMVWTFESRTTPGVRHRIMCGDSRDAGDVATLTDGKQVQGVFTSPPYAERRKEQYGGVPADEYVDWWGPVQETVRSVIKEDGSFFVNIKAHCEGGERNLYVLDLVTAMKRRWDWMVIDQFAWVRQSAPGAWTNRFKNSFEDVWQFALTGGIKFEPWNVAHETESAFAEEGPRRERATGSGFGTKPEVPGLALPGNVIHTHNSLQGGHAAAFPPELPEFFLKAFSDPGAVWYEPFAGSGSTVCAAERAGRLCYAIEIQETYCGVILQRVSDLGLEPVCVSGGGNG